MSSESSRLSDEQNADQSRNTDCTESHIVTVIDHIRARLGFLIEMVNMNVDGRQYVCAGDKRSLNTLQKVTDRLHREPELLRSTEDLERLVSAECKTLDETLMTKALIRGRATVPLTGIDVPFHSKLMSSMRGLFRLTLQDGIEKSAVQADDLKGRWIPNVTGAPFSLDDDYVARVHELTGCQDLLRWSSRRGAAQLRAE